MSVLSDLSLRTMLDCRRLLIDALGENAIQPASVDLTLGPILLVPGPGQHVNFKEGVLPDKHRQVPIHKEPYCLKPGEAVLGATHEAVTIPDDLVGFVEGRSSIARVFMQIHAAGLLDPGYHGHPTLEIVNHGPHTIWLNAGDPICQLVLLRLTTRCERPYGSEGLGSRYQGDVMPSGARRTA